MRQTPHESTSALVSKESFLIYSLISVLSVPLAIVEELNLKNLLLSIYAGTTITAVMGLYIFFANFLIFRQPFSLLEEKKRILITNLLVISSAGALRGILVYFSFDLLLISQPSDFAQRILTSTATTIFWLTTISIIARDSKDYQNRYTRILHDSILKYVSKNEKYPSSDMNLNLAQELKGIENLLKITLDELVNSKHNQKTLLLAASNLRIIAEEVVRPLSNRMLLKENQVVPSFKTIPTLENSIRKILIDPLVVSIFLFLISIFNLPIAFGVTKGLAGAAFISTVSYAILKIFKIFVFPKSRNEFIRGLSFIIFAGLIISTCIYLFNEYILELTTATYSFVYIVIIAVVVILSSMRENSMSDRNILLENLASYLNSRTNLSSKKFTNEAVASFLHNSLQSDLLALSHQLEATAEEPFSDKTREILERAGARINRSISQEFQDFLDEPLTRLSRIQSSWNGIASVQVDLPNPLGLDSRKEFLLVQIIEEAINNAVRSANAKRITVIGRMETSGRFVLTVSNDGIPEISSNKGFGSKWLDEHFNGYWNRQYVNGETILEIIL